MNTANQKAIKILRRAAHSRLQLSIRKMEWADVDAYLILLQKCRELGDPKAYADIMRISKAFGSLMLFVP